MNKKMEESEWVFSCVDGGDDNGGISEFCGESLVSLC